MQATTENLFRLGLTKPEFDAIFELREILAQETGSAYADIIVTVQTCS